MATGDHVKVGNASILLVIVLMLIIGPFSCSTVSPGHRGVAVTLGSVDQEMRREGLTFKLPFLTSIHEISIKQEMKQTKAAAFSSDLQTIDILVNVLYKIPENKVVTLYQQYSGDVFTSLIEPRIQECLKEITATQKAEEMVKNREKIKAQLIEKVRTVMMVSSKNGVPEKEMEPLINIVDVVINNVDLTKELEDAIEKKQVMEQQAKMKEYELSKEQKEAEIVLVKAKAEAESVRIKGEALKNSPEVIQLEIAKRWNGVAPLSVSTNSGGANILLPIEQKVEKQEQAKK